MPKLLFRRKKKKAKPSIKDALAPHSAFVAVPNTPPPETSSKDKPHFTFPTKPEISSPIPISPPAGSSGTSQQQQQDYVGSYTLVGPGDFSGEESEAEPGYATVRRDPPETASSQRPSSRQDGPKTSKRDSPLPPTPDEAAKMDDNKLSTPPLIDKAPSISELPSVTSELSVHSDSSMNSSLNSGSPFKQTQNPSGEKQLSEGEIAAMYAKVMKNKKVVGEKNEQSPSADLPPKAPRDSPVTPRSRKGKEKSGRNHEGSASSPKKRTSSKHSTGDDKRTRKHQTSQSPAKSSEMAEKHKDSHRQEEFYDERVAEYSDEDYLPSCEDSVTISENFFDELEQELLHSPRSRYRSRSATYPSQQHPVSEKSFSKSQSVKKSRTLSARPASSPHASGYSTPQIPMLHPSFMQSVPVQKENQAYVFSETQPDGSVQYFTATPIYSPTAQSTPTRVFQYPPAQSTLPPMAVNVPTMMSVPGQMGLTESGY